MPDQLVVRDLHIHAGKRGVVNGVGFTLDAGRMLALVGASGSGKTLTAMSCLGLVRPKPGVTGGEVHITAGGQTHSPYAARSKVDQERAFHAVRGRIVGYLPQHARASLNPLWTVERQVKAVLELRGKEAPLQGDDARPEKWLALAGFPTPGLVLTLFAHELSGGMAQRVCIALALARGSRFLICDEPTTGLDPTVQSGILRHLRELRDQGIGVLLITHDLRIVPSLADEVLVMHEGYLVDQLPADALHTARSAQAQRLLAATARIAGGLL